MASEKFNTGETAAAKILDKTVSKFLNTALRGVHSNEQLTPQEVMTVYTAVHNQCLDRSHDRESQHYFYERYCTIIGDFIATDIMPSLREKQGESMLADLWKRWLDHKLVAKGLYRFFSYLDRSIVQRESLQPLAKAALRLFRELVFEEIKGRATDAVISLINEEREGGRIDRALLKNVLSIYVDVDGDDYPSMENYPKYFEASFLKDTAEYYRRKSSVWVLDDCCADYMRRAEECLKSERERVSNYLRSRTEEFLLPVVREEVIMANLSRLLEEESTGFGSLIRAEKVDDLSRIFKLCYEIEGGLDPVLNSFRQLITDEGKALFQHESLVRDLLNLHDKHMRFVKGCFEKNILFHRSLKEAFEVFCNKGPSESSMAELLAAFCDCILKGGGSSGEESVEQTLEKVLVLLGFVDDKDNFAEFCRKKLARRLLSDVKANSDREKSFLSMLRQMYGGQFSSKMERMVQDCALVTQHGAANYPGIELTVSVLTTGFWPSYKSLSLNLPAEMARSIELFSDSYLARNKRQRLTWVHSLGYCHIMGNFQSKTIELVVTTLQASALLLFNTQDRLSYTEIVSQLNVSDEDTSRLLHSLSCGKYKVLKKEPDTKCISHSDYFEFNADFTDRSVSTVRIPLHAGHEKKKVINVVEEDRRFAIDASIVRIMKSRKVLEHKQLVNLCVQQLSRTFKPDMKAIKKRVEDLISRSFLERDSQNNSLYKYLP